MRRSNLYAVRESVREALPVAGASVAPALSPRVEAGGAPLKDEAKDQAPGFGQAGSPPAASSKAADARRPGEAAPAGESRASVAAAPAPPAPTTPAAPAAEGPASRPADVIRPGDSLQIVLSDPGGAGPAGAAGTVKTAWVGGDGTVALQGVGTFHCGGLTPQEASRSLTRALRTRQEGGKTVEATIVRLPVPDRPAVAPEFAGPAPARPSASPAPVPAPAPTAAPAPAATPAPVTRTPAVAPPAASPAAEPLAARPTTGPAVAGEAPTERIGQSAVTESFPEPLAPPAADQPVDVVIVVQQAEGAAPAPATQPAGAAGGGPGTRSSTDARL